MNTKILKMFSKVAQPELMLDKHFLKIVLKSAYTV